MASVAPTRPFAFPDADGLPPGVRVDTARYDLKYLIDGEVRTWAGEAADVLSPVCVRHRDGSLRARGGRARAHARCAAERSRPWPQRAAPGTTAAASGRPCASASASSAMEQFVDEHGRVREDVVRLLMWEIGKTRKRRRERVRSHGGLHPRHASRR